MFAFLRVACLPLGHNFVSKGLTHDTACIRPSTALPEVKPARPQCVHEEKALPLILYYLAGYNVSAFLE